MRPEDPEHGHEGDLDGLERPDASPRSGCRYTEEKHLQVGCKTINQPKKEGKKERNNILMHKLINE